jgi:hypothetical protein
MSLLRRRIGGLGLVAALAAILVAAQPSPPVAHANVVCGLGGKAAGAVSGGIDAITGGGVGGGNPVDDVCNTVSGGVGGIVKKPLGDALAGVGNGIFEQITQWVSDGAAWLIGEVVKGIEKTTTPQLASKGFVAQYGKMAAVAALLGMAMLLLAVIEGVAQGNAALLVRVALVNVPLAFIATSVAYLVVQVLLVATDGLCDAVASASGRNGQRFFEGAINDLGQSGGTVGGELGGANPGAEATGTAAVPLFVTFLAAVIGAFAAFGVWLELIMRDAAVYVVALFMPFSLAASIWPRWTGAMRRSVELLLVVISSKFVIVSIIALAAGLLADPGEGIEPILAASALMLLACFAPFVLLKFVPFAEGAMSAAYNRRSAAGGGVGAVQLASNAQILRNMAKANWGESGVTLWNAGGQGGGSPGPEPSGPRGGGGKGPGRQLSPGGGSGGVGGEKAAGGGAVGAGGIAGAAGAAAAAPVAAARGAQSAAGRLAGSSVSQSTGTESGAAGPPGGKSATQGQQAAEPTSSTTASTPGPAPSETEGGGSRASEKPPRPAPEQPGVKPERGEK